MSTLYGAAQGVNAHHAGAIADHQAKTPKYHLMAGDEYLHWSGAFLTVIRLHAWIGTIEQARKCRRKFDAAAGCKARRVIAMPQLGEMA